MIEPNVKNLIGADMSLRAEPTSLTYKNKSPYSVPKDYTSENIPEVRSPTTPSHTNALDTPAGYVPFRHNRSKPPN